MLFKIDAATSKRATTPHELSMMNLAVFHLLAAPASIALNIGLWGFFVPLALSLSVIGFLWLQAKKFKQQGPWFIAAHWRLAANRTNILIIGYLVAATILGFAFLVSSGSSKGGIMMVALSRLAVVPLLIAVMICFVLESTSVAQARRGEVPDGLAKRFTPPDSLVVIEGLKVLQPEYPGGINET